MASADNKILEIREKQIKAIDALYSAYNAGKELDALTAQIDKNSCSINVEMVKFNRAMIKKLVEDMDKIYREIEEKGYHD